MYFKILENNISILLNCSIVLTALAEVPVPLPSTPHYVVIKPEIIYIQTTKTNSVFFIYIFMKFIYPCIYACVHIYTWTLNMYIYM